MGSLSLPVLRQQLGAGDVKHPDGPGGGSTREDLEAGVEGHRAGGVLRHKVKQLENNRYNGRGGSLRVGELGYLVVRTGCLRFIYCHSTRCF